MKFERLRLTGFKSFCDSAEFRIEPGLTGVVGPNGCGKSNLVEALRWVMGESSFKNMRASGMEDVIFAGSGRRPSRNNAEVGLLLDNSDRRAPAAFNDSETIEVTRRIERDLGSTYRVNGKEVRARDVQLLFADASTGARSPSLVRQGQIGEIISAKPQARRLILEEAAGVSGLHSRRHEAELRLKGAEDNLTRVEDVLKQIDAQVDSLKRQARQANRYRELAGAIRRHEALARLIAWREHEAAFADARRRLDADLIEVAERTRAQAEAARLQALAAAALPPLREEEARRGAALHRIALAREALEAEEKRAKEREAELERRIAQFAGDLQREEALIADAAGVMDRLAAEDAALAEQGAQADEDAARAREAEARAPSAASPAPKARSPKRRPPRRTSTRRRRALLGAVEEEGRRLARLEAECAAIERERAALSGRASRRRSARRALRPSPSSPRRSPPPSAKRWRRRSATPRLAEIEARRRGPLAEAERAAQRLETEARTLAGLLGSDSSGPWPRAVDAVSVARGYEAALGAALGDDLDASVDEAAPAHWSLIAPAGDDPLLPAGADPLAARVAAPPALARRLAQVGVVARAEGKRLAQDCSSPASGWSRSKAISGAGTASSPPPKRRLRPRVAWRRRIVLATSSAKPRPRARRSRRSSVEAASAAERGPRGRRCGSGMASAGARRARGVGRRPRRFRPIRARARPDPVAPVGGRGGLCARRRRAQRGRRTQSRLPRPRLSSLGRATTSRQSLEQRARGGGARADRLRRSARDGAIDRARDCRRAPRGAPRSPPSGRPGASGAIGRKAASANLPSAGRKRSGNRPRSPTRRPNSPARAARSPTNTIRRKQRARRPPTRSRWAKPRWPTPTAPPARRSKR